MPSQEWTIEALQTVKDLQRTVPVQIETWGQGQLMPPDLLYASVKAGGLVLAAVDATGEVIGFSYGFPARRRDLQWMWSHALAVTRDQRGSGIGEALKWAQRDAALRDGYDLISWTYDPLLGPNAHLNVAKLGGIVERYEIDYYGEMDDDLNRGLPSDRLILDWYIGSERVRRHRDGRNGVGERPGDKLEEGSAKRTGERPGESPGEKLGWLPRLIQSGEGPLPAFQGLAAIGEPEELLVEIPPDHQAMRRQDMALALEWRLGVREALTRYLSKGYRIVGFHRLPAEGGGVRNYYRLKRCSLDEALEFVD